MPDHPLGIGLFDDTVAHLDDDWFSAIEAGGLDADFFSWEQPADRQRFKRSLGKPLLLAVNTDPELGGLVVKGCKGCDKIRPGK